MKISSSVFKRSMSAVLCAAMAVSICCIFSGTAQAATSLPAIETIKSSQEDFTILEIVPSANQGSIGYYIDGQEPWVTLAGKKTSPEARKLFINGSINVESELRGLLNKSRTDDKNAEYNYSIALVNPKGESASDNYPLNFGGDYTEVYPWVWATAAETTYKGYKKMHLAAEEKATAKGSMEYVGAGYGDYSIGDFEYVGNKGDCVQLVTGFKTDPAPGDKGYWYNVKLTELKYDVLINAPNEKALKWSVIYEEVTGTDEHDITLSGKHYSYVGVVGQRDFPGLDISKTYYMATFEEPYETKPAPSTGANEYTLFADTSGGFRDKESGETGYFSKISYTYAGYGYGAYAFTPSENGNEYYVSTKIVYYTKGITNNNWFLKYVLDYDDNEITSGLKPIPHISVNTIAAKDVTDRQIDAADMIVLNYGFNIGGDTFSSIYKNEFSADLESSFVGKLSTTKKPIIFDYNMTGLTSGSQIRIKDTAEALLNNALANRNGSGFNTSIEHTFVGGNIYCIDGTGWTKPGGSSDDPDFHAPLPLATKFFNTASELTGDYLKKSDSFYPVFEEIYYENFLREIRNDDEILSSKVSMATVIRYIINYAKTRVTDKKTTVRVLDIEPRTGSITDDQKVKLAEWLRISQANLIVTTMSTAEFIGTKADISEDYDLLYIGDSVTGFNIDQPSGFPILGNAHPAIPKYNCSYITYKDNSMTYYNLNGESCINLESAEKYLANRTKAGWFKTETGITFGMRYTSIGDKVNSGSSYKLSGLLDRDYTNFTYNDVVGHPYYFGTVINTDQATNTFRYSGNDLTTAASKKITNFANSGYPVILADSLLKPPEIDEGTITVAKAHNKPLSLSFDYSAKPAITIADSILKVTLEKADNLFYSISSATCQLYKNGLPAKDGDGKDAILTLNPYRSCSYNLSDYNYKSGDKFYCTVTITDARYPLLPVFSRPTITDQVGKTATITIRSQAEEMFVDNSSVMYSSINSIASKTNVMNWSSLTSTVTDIKQTLLARFVNLSKPNIQFWNGTSPTPYTMDSNGVMSSLVDHDGDGVYNLTYVFKILNNSDPYPDKTRYKCSLYLDLNSNGLFEENEIVTDVGLRDWIAYSPDYGNSGQRIENGNLKGSYGTADTDQHYYYLSYEIPGERVGLIPWKLEVQDVSFFGGHDSVIDYTRVAPRSEPATVKILQINSIGDGSFNLQENIALSNGTYNTLFKGISSDFKINITTIPANFESTWTNTATSYGTTTTGSTGSTTVSAHFTKYTEKVDNKDVVKYSRKTDSASVDTFDSLKKLFESYDMLIIGFGDAYRNLNYNVTTALADYIKDGNPVLMTHDTLSFYSISDNNFATNSSTASHGIKDYTKPSNWTEYRDFVYGTGATVSQYYPNMLLRNLVGVDRYGVTSTKALTNGQTIGVTKYTDAALKAYIQSLPGFSNWDGGYVPSASYYSNAADADATRQALLNEVSEAGYSIAWKADKARRQTVSETQGLNNEVLFRFMDTSVSAWISGKNIDSYTIKYTNNDSSRLGLSTKLSQVNKGQITTYPYNINTAAFNGSMYNPNSDNNMGVQVTHAQNYQLNMNSDDMIVWYCLAPDSTYGDGIYQNNDVVNAYYIYTCGNVTYTGSGHTAMPATYSASNTSANSEAKLFINTMIAAYRAEKSQSTVSFSNEDGTVKGITDFFVVTDGDTVLSLDGTKYKDSARKIYFTINDSNVDAGKTMTASFSYKDALDLKLSVYNADSADDKPVYTYINDDGKLGVGHFVNGNTTLVSTYTYYIYLDDLINAIKTIYKKESLTLEDLNQNLKVDLSTKLTTGSGTPTISSATLNLRQYRLFDLS